jgi:tRNA pseudouridine synthase 10
MVVLQGLSLCRLCQKRLGVKLDEIDLEDSCYVCAGAMTLVKPLSEDIVEELKKYDYNTFLVGASVPHTILDNDDELRSRFKIKGRDSIKSQITKMLSQKVKTQTGKTVNYSKPDLTILASIGDRQISINLRSLWLAGKYVKLKRGLPQRSSVCGICNGLGCAECGYRGRSLESIQGKITDFLTSTFEAESCNFVWLGSEDENSLVKSPGRPFFVEAVKPRKRFAMMEKLGAANTNSPKGRRTPFFRTKEIQVRDLQLLEKRITDVPLFEITAVVHLKKKPEAPFLDPSQKEAVESNFMKARASVRLSRKFRTVQKEIYWIRCKLGENGETLQLEINCDGGIPLKKLVSGQDDTVTPNLGQYLHSYEIDREQPFDIVKVRIKDGTLPPSRTASTTAAALNVPDYDE